MAATQTPFLTFRGFLKGHNGAVTSLSVPQASAENQTSRLLSSSRDKTLIVWDVEASGADPLVAGTAVRCLKGHNDSVSDAALSSNGHYAVSGSWDRTLRLWDVESGECVTLFQGHSADVFSVSFSPDNLRIISASRDRSLKVWNSKGRCKFTISPQTNGNQAHSDWISCVRFSPNKKSEAIISVGWDKQVKVWRWKGATEKTDEGASLDFTLTAHEGPIYACTLSPDGTLCASGGKDGNVILWDINEYRALFSLVVGETVNALAFSSAQYWLCVATDKFLQIWDLEARQIKCVIKPEDIEAKCAELSGADENVVADATTATQGKKKEGFLPWITSCTWCPVGASLYVGTSKGEILVFDVQA